MRYVGEVNEGVLHNLFKSFDSNGDGSIDEGAACICSHYACMHPMSAPAVLVYLEAGGSQQPSLQEP